MVGRVRATAMMAAVLVAGCEVPVPEVNSQVPEAEPTGNADMPATTPSPPAPAAPPTVATTSLPASFLGRWGLVPADCTSTRGDAKGLMTVEADRLRFYESVANVDRVEPVSPIEVRVHLAFTGEGQTWREETPLRLEENGNAIVRIGQGQQLRYARCGG